MADPDYFTLEEFRDLADMSDDETYTDAKVLAAAAYFVEIVEREVGRPMVSREFTETFDGAGQRGLVLGQVDVTEVSDVTVNGDDVDPTGLTVASGVLRFLGGGLWSGAAPSNVVVTYTAGKTAECPADVKDAVMWATRDRLVNQSGQNGIDPRKSSQSNDLGGTTTYLLPGEKRPTGYPDLDAVIASYVRNTASLGFA